MLRARAWDRDQYELIDFGGGRKLERFGLMTLDRPSPAAEPFERSTSVDWSQADIRVDAKGKNELETPTTPWQVRFGQMVFNLKLTPFGHVGLFPEQADNWRWLHELVSGHSTQQPQHAKPPALDVTALNLFAYTGGTTLALALAGAQVVHVDASSPAVNWGRSNAQASGLQDHPIRWIVEDARKFVERERRRGSLYDIIVMDPPTYGHGPKGKPWALAEHLPGLIEDAIALLRPNGDSYLLITAHSELPALPEIVEMIRCRNSEPPALETGRLQLVDRRSRQLDAGFFIRAQFGKF